MIAYVDKQPNNRRLTQGQWMCLKNRREQINTFSLMGCCNTSTTGVIYKYE